MSDNEGSICPISREARCTPRVSIDVCRDRAAEAPGGRAVALQQDRQQPRRIDAPVAMYQQPSPPPPPAAAAAARAKYLQPDGRLSLRGMMVEQDNEAAGGDRASSFRRQGSLLLRSKSSRSLSGSQHGSGSGSGRGGGGGGSSSLQHNSSGATATWHASAAWATVTAATADAGDAAAADGSKEDDACGTGAVVLPSDVQLLAGACWRRDAKALQQLLARRVSTTHALDAAGNTALHAVLLPQGTWQPPSMPACVEADAAGAAAMGAGSQSRGAGVFSCFAACFGQQAAATTASDMVDGSIRAGSSRAGGRLSLVSTAAAQLHMVGALLGACADANVRNRRGQTPLMLAALAVASSRTSAQAAAALRVLEVLAGHVMTDINMKDNGGRTALALLLLPPGEQLLQHGAAPGSFRGSAAAAAPVSAKQQVVKQRTAAASGGEAVAGNASAISLLGGSIAGGVGAAAQLKGAHVLVHAGADPNAADTDGLTPLMHAAALPGVSRELLLLLLERGANPRQFDNRRRTALTHAVLAHGLQPVPALGLDPSRLRQGGTCAVCGCAPASSGGLIGVAPAPPEVPAHGDDVFTSGSTQGAAAAVSVRSSSEADSGGAGSSSNSSSRSPALGGLHGCSNGSGGASACSFCGRAAGSAVAGSSGSLPPVPHPGHGAAIRALCSFGALDLWPASVNSRYPGLHCFSQLHIAMRRGDLGAVDMLLAAGADVDAQDAGGNTPLMYWPVAPAEPAELVEELLGRLLAQGADANLLNNDGLAPLDLACELDKLGKVAVKPACVPAHATLVGWGARNSSAFKAQHANGAPLLCMRADSSILNGSKRFGSIRAASTQELQSQVAALRHGA